MKLLKIIFLFLVLICSAKAYSFSYVDGEMVTGMVRLSISNYNGLQFIPEEIAHTNDFVFCLNSVVAHPAGIYQLVTGGWTLVNQLPSTNYTRLLNSGTYAASSNVKIWISTTNQANKTFTTNKINSGLTNLHTGIALQNLIYATNTVIRSYVNQYSTNTTIKGYATNWVRNYTTQYSTNSKVLTWISTTNQANKTFTTNKINSGLTNLHNGMALQNLIYATNTVIRSYVNQYATNGNVKTWISTTNQRHYTDDLKFATNTVIRSYVNQYATNSKVLTAISTTNQANKTFTTNKINSGLTNLHTAFANQNLIYATNTVIRSYVNQYATNSKVLTAISTTNQVNKTFTTNKVNSGLTNLHTGIALQNLIYATNTVIRSYVNQYSTNSKVLTAISTTNQANKTFTTNKINSGLTNLHTGIALQNLIYATNSKVLTAISTTNQANKTFTTNKINSGLTNLHTGIALQNLIYATNSVIRSYVNQYATNGNVKTWISTTNQATIGKIGTQISTSNTRYGYITASREASNGSMYSNFTRSQATLNSNFTKSISSSSSNYVNTVRQYLNPGVYQQPTITFTTNGRVDIGTNGYIDSYATPDLSGAIYRAKVPTLTNQMIQSNTTYYLLAVYNNGAPYYLLTSTLFYLINGSSVHAAASLFWEHKNNVNQTHIIDFNNSARAPASKLESKSIRINGFERQNGLSISESYPRYFQCSAGTVWYGTVAYSLAAMNTSTGLNGTLHRYFKTNGSWFVQQTNVYNNLYFQGVSNRGVVNDGAYVTTWFYRDVSSTGSLTVFGIFGNLSNASLLAAQSLAPPIDLPPVIRANSILIGRIIVEKGSNNSTQIDSVFTTTFAQSSVVKHNDLTGIQGGAIGDYQHLSTEMYNQIANMSNVFVSKAEFSEQSNLFSQRMGSISNSLAVKISNNRVSIVALSNRVNSVSNIVYSKSISQSSNASKFISTNISKFWAGNYISTSNTRYGYITSGRSSTNLSTTNQATIGKIGTQISTSNTRYAYTTLSGAGNLISTSNTRYGYMTSGKVYTNISTTNQANKTFTYTQISTTNQTTVGLIGTRISTSNTRYGYNAHINSASNSAVSYATNWIRNDTNTTRAFFVGIYVPPTIVNNGNGTLTIGNGTYALYPTPTHDGQIRKYDIPGRTIQLRTNAENYIVAEYRPNGTTILTNRPTMVGLSESATTPVVTCYLEKDGELYTQDWDTMAKGLPNKLNKMLRSTQRFRWASGLTLTTGTNRRIFTTEGIVWNSASECEIKSFSSQIHSGELLYHATNGGWTNRNDFNVYTNNVYDNGHQLISTPIGGGINHYTVNWIYRMVQTNRRLYVILGNENYPTSALAEASQPQIPPDYLSMHGILIGKIIVAEGTISGATIPYAIYSAFNVAFSPSGIAQEHSSLSQLDYASSGHTGFISSNSTISTINSATNVYHTWDTNNSLHKIGVSYIAGNNIYRATGGEIGFTNMGSDARFIFDRSNGIQNGSGQGNQIYSYWPLILQGNRRLSGTPAAITGSDNNVNTLVDNALTANVVNSVNLVTRGNVSQVTNLFQAQRSDKSIVARILINGAIESSNITVHGTLLATSIPLVGTEISTSNARYGYNSHINSASNSSFIAGTNWVIAKAYGSGSGGWTVTSNIRYGYINTNTTKTLISTTNQATIGKIGTQISTSNTRYAYTTLSGAGDLISTSNTRYAYTKWSQTSNIRYGFIDTNTVRSIDSASNTALRFYITNTMISSNYMKLARGMATSNWVNANRPTTNGLGFSKNFPVDIDRCGFLDNNVQTAINYNSTSAVFVLSNKGTSWNYYNAGKKHTITSNKSVLIPTQGFYFVYITGTNGTLTATKDSWNLNDDGRIPVATIMVSNSLTPKFMLSEERHTVLIDRRMHRFNHFLEGTKLVSGGSLTGLSTVSTANTNKTFGIVPTVIADEDLFLTLPGHPDGNSVTNNYTILYRTSPTTWKWTNSTMPFIDFGTRITYDNNGVQTTIGAGDFANWYLVACNIQGSQRFLIMQGRGDYVSLAEAQAESFSTFSLTGIPLVEFVVLQKIIYQESGALSAANKGECIYNSTQAVSANISSSVVISSTPHNTLSGLDGGTNNQYYHLTQNEYFTKASTNWVLDKGYANTNFVKSSTNTINVAFSTTNIEVTTNILKASGFASTNWVNDKLSSVPFCSMYFQATTNSAFTYPLTYNQPNYTVSNFSARVIPNTNLIIARFNKGATNDCIMINSEAAAGWYEIEYSTSASAVAGTADSVRRTYVRINGVINMESYCQTINDSGTTTTAVNKGKCFVYLNYLDTITLGLYVRVGTFPMRTANLFVKRIQP